MTWELLYKVGEEIIFQIFGTSSYSSRINIENLISSPILYTAHSRSFKKMHMYTYIHIMLCITILAVIAIVPY